jgi:hypothetical protein
MLDDPQQIDISIPLNTRVAGGVIVHANLCLPTDISFQDFFSCVCAHMDLDLLDAKIGYKYGFDCVHDPPNWLLSEEDLCVAMEKG